MALYSALPTEVPSTRLREVRFLLAGETILPEEIGLEGASKYAIENEVRATVHGKGWARCRLRFGLS